MRAMLLLLLTPVTAVASDNSVSCPNILVILTDDQGWGDLSLHGNRNLSTPHLDSLAHQGAAFEHFYVCAVCAPTRAEFLTGRYYPRTGVSGVSRGEGRLNADETTIAQVFQQAGYATGCFGKWHNGTQAPLHPNDKGFDEFYGFTSGHWGHYFSPPLDHNRQRVRGNGYIADDFTNHAIRFIKASRDRPFFCYLAFNTPHSPMMVPDSFYEKFADQNPVMQHRDPDREDVMMTRAALAMCENIDWNAGRLLTALEALGIARDTIVVYFSDNGPNSFRWNGGMKGRKGSIDEGGVRSPCFVRWPEQIAAGLKIPQIAGAIDLRSTLADLAGIHDASDKPLDGISLAPLLLQSTDDWPDRTLLSIRKGQVSVRSQRFRLDTDARLFDITNDRGQRKDVADRFPKAAAELLQTAEEQGRVMRQCLADSADRPFHVGFAASTTLPARDGLPHGMIQRSSRAPNNSFFTHWTSEDDAITWDVLVGQRGIYRVTVYYTCAAGDEGVTVKLSVDGGNFVSAAVTEVFDPLLYAKPYERVTKSHYFVKDFRPQQLGRIELREGRQTFRLTAPNIPGQRAIDVHSIELTQFSR